MRTRTRSTSGFTLIELLIAAAIVVIIIAIVSQNLVSYLHYTGTIRTDVNIRT